MELSYPAKNWTAKACSFPFLYIALLIEGNGVWRSAAKKKFVATTIRTHLPSSRYNNLTETLALCNWRKKWVQIYKILVGDQWNYLTHVMDLADRKNSGLALSEDMTVRKHQWKPGWMHVDLEQSQWLHLSFWTRGVQYASNKNDQSVYFQ